MRVYIHMYMTAVVALLATTVSSYAYSIKVTNYSGEDIWIAVYRHDTERSRLYRASSIQYITGQGATVSLNGIHQNYGSTQYELYGVPAPEIFQPYFINDTTLPNDMSLITNVGTNDVHFFIHGPYEPVDTALDIIAAEDIIDSIEAADDATAAPNTVSVTEATQGISDNTNVETSDSDTNIAIAPEDAPAYDVISDTTDITTDVATDDSTSTEPNVDQEQVVASAETSPTPDIAILVINNVTVNPAAENGTVSDQSTTPVAPEQTTTPSSEVIEPTVETVIAADQVPSTEPAESSVDNLSTSGTEQPSELTPIPTSDASEIPATTDTTEETAVVNDTALTDQSELVTSAPLTEDVSSPVAAPQALPTPDDNTSSNNQSIPVATDGSTNIVVTPTSV